MHLFPLPLFPDGPLRESVVTTVWVGVFVISFFNLRFGWTYSGLVVPGYLVPLLLNNPVCAAITVAEGVLAYFDAVGQEGTPTDAAHPICTREELKAYDPDLFALVNETMAYDGHVDWRYTPYQP